MLLKSKCFTLYSTKAIVTHAAQSVAIRIFSFGSLRTIVRAIATNAANAIMIFVVANNFPVLATMYEDTMAPITPVP